MRGTDTGIARLVRMGRSPLARAVASPSGRAVLGLLLVLVLGCVFHQDGAFFRPSTHRAMLREIAVQGILASGMTLVVVAGGIDLAVGSVLSLSAVCFSALLLWKGISAWIAIPAVLGIGALTGLGSGSLVSFVRMPPFIATLAMMVFSRGLAKQISGGRKVTAYVEGSGASAADLPDVFRVVDSTLLGGSLPMVTLLFAVSVLLAYVVLSRLRVGRYIHAVGGNAEAARLAGVPVRAVTLLVYGASGLLAGLAGICQAAQETHGDPETGAGYELDAIAMVVLGGTPLAGGRGGVGLTVVGALTLGYVQKILSLNAYSTEARLMLTGVILVVAVALQSRGRSAQA
jgi:ribose transport system permease protein